MPQQAGPPVVRIRDAPVVAAVDARDAVVPRQAVVQERVVGRQQLQHAAVGAHLAVEEQLRFAPECFSEVVVERREERAVRGDGLQVPEIQPLSGEVGGQRAGARVVEHPQHLSLQHGGVAQPPLLGQRQQLVVRDAAPQEERQPRREVDVGNPVRRPGLDSVRVALDAQQELGRDEQRFQRPLDAGFEAALFVSGRVRQQQRVHVGAGDRPAEGAARQIRQDLPGARFFIRRPVRIAHENGLPAARVAVGVGHLSVVRADYLDAEHDRIDRHPRVLEARNGRIRRACVVRDAAVERADERRADEARARLYRDAHVQQAADARAGSGPPVLVGVKVEQLDQTVIQPELQLVSGARHRLVEGAFEADAEHVFAIQREVVPHGHAAPRAERQVLVHAAFLQQQRRRLVHRRAGAERRIADGAPADLGRRRHVARHQPGRHRQHVADVVEAVARIVGRQQRAPVHLQLQQVAHGVGIFRPVETVDLRRPARIWRRFRRAVQRRLQVRDERRVGGGVRPGAAVGGHQARAQLAHDLFPDVRVARDLRHVHLVELQAGRAQALVMAAHAVAPQRQAVRFQLRRHRRLRRRLRGSRRQHAGQRQRGDQAPGGDGSQRHLSGYRLPWRRPCRRTTSGRSSTVFPRRGRRPTTAAARPFRDS